MTYTAPDGQTRDMGFILPAANDLIRDGDNVITNNAKTAAGAFTAALRTVDNLSATATLLPGDAEPTAEVTGTLPNKVINLGIPRGKPGPPGDPGMGYEEGQALLTQNQTTLDAAQAAQTAAETAATDAAQSTADAIRDNLATDLNTPGTPAYDAIVATAAEVTGPAVTAVVDRILVDATGHGVTGDGATDDTAALNALVLAVSNAGGGTIVLPVGTYMVDSLTGASHVTVRGADRDGSVIRKITSSAEWIIAGESTGFTLAHLTVDAHDLTTTRAVTYSGSSVDCTLEDVTVRNVGTSYALGTLSGAQGVTLRRCRLQSVNLGIRVAGTVTQVRITGNRFTDWHNSAVYIVGTENDACTDVLIAENTIDPHSTEATSSAIRQPIRLHGHDTNHHRNVIIRGNTVTGTYTNHADTLAPGSADLISLHRCTGFEVSGNTVRGGGDVGLTIAQGCRDGRVFGNLAEDNDTVGLCLGSAGSAVNVRNITVTGNTFRNNALDHADTGGQTIDRAVERAKAHILAVQAEECVIDSNVMVYTPDHPNSTRYAITWRESTNTHVGAVGAGNKSSGHSAPYYSDTPASSGMTTTATAPLTTAAEAERLNLGGIQVIVGSGEPEGSITADRGSVYLRTAGAAGEQIYYKNQSGNSSGWRPSSVSAAQNSRNLGDRTHPINAAGKFAGRQVFDTTEGRPLWASNATPTGVWYDATGAVAITPN